MGSRDTKDGTTVAKPHKPVAGGVFREAQGSRDSCAGRWAVAREAKKRMLKGMFDVIATQIASAAEKLAYLRRFL